MPLIYWKTHMNYPNPRTYPGQIYIGKDFGTLGTSQDHLRNVGMYGLPGHPGWGQLSPKFQAAFHLLSHSPHQDLGRSSVWCARASHPLPAPKMLSLCLWLYQPAMGKIPDVVSSSPNVSFIFLFLPKDTACPVAFSSGAGFSPTVLLPLGQELVSSQFLMSPPRTFSFSPIKNFPALNLTSPDSPILFLPCVRLPDAV